MNYVQFIASRLPARPFRGRYGERFAGLIGGLLSDLIAEGASLVIQSVWLIAGQPADALSYIGSDKRLRRYLVETDEQYRARIDVDPLTFVDRGIEIWEKGGSNDCLEEQLEAAGYAGGRIFSPRDWDRPPHNHITQFWAFLPFTSHADGTPFHRAGDGSLCGSATCGDGTPFTAPTRAGSTASIAGQHIAGITASAEVIEELRHIVRQFKSGNEVCRQVIVEIDAPTCGSGIFCNDGHKCGGTLGLIGTGVIEE